MFSIEAWLLVLNAFLCPLYISAKPLPVCPMYALLQSRHVSLNAPERMYLSGTSYFRFGSFWILLFVLSAILRPAFLNKFVINMVSLPMYINDAHFYLVVPACPFGELVGCLGLGGLCV